LSENIGYGDPAAFNDTDKIHRAAELGGALEFIEKLPHKFDSFVIRPYTDYSSSEPSRESAYAGKRFDFSKLNLNGPSHDLSGGQKQRIAL